MSEVTVSQGTVLLKTIIQLWLLTMTSSVLARRTQTMTINLNTVILAIITRLDFNSCYSRFILSWEGGQSRGHQFWLRQWLDGNIDLAAAPARVTESHSHTRDAGNNGAFHVHMLGPVFSWLCFTMDGNRIILIIWIISWLAKCILKEILPENTFSIITLRKDPNL